MSLVLYPELISSDIQQNDIFISGVTEADSAQTLINGF